MEKRQQDQMVTFLKQFAFFSQLTLNALVKISYHLQLKTFDRSGMTVLKEGDPSEWVALIRDGEF